MSTFKKTPDLVNLKNILQGDYIDFRKYCLQYLDTSSKCKL